MRFIVHRRLTLLLSPSDVMTDDLAFKIFPLNVFLMTGRHLPPPRRAVLSLSHLHLLREEPPRDLPISAIHALKRALWRPSPSLRRARRVNNSKSPFIGVLQSAELGTTFGSRCPCCLS